MTEKKKPVFEERVGAIRVTIWENYDDKGNPFHNVNIVRRYKKGDDWADSSSFTGLSDLALLGEAKELAVEWLRDHAQRKARGEFSQDV